MKAMLYLAGKEDPAAVLDEVKLIQLNDNHKVSPLRISFKSSKFNAGKTMTELHRHEKMHLRLEDGRSADVLLQHSSLDMQGNAVGVLRVLGDLVEAAPA
ncbi:MAG TPA: hypothetical protein GYA08_20365 [Chloroflexi bacterium]|nr:hypothetical protein [Chloroflexota bacterium]